MESSDYRAICLEGGDQVGKADATNNLFLGLEKLNINLTPSSFPIYSTPIGASIRLLLKQGCPEEILPLENSLEARMALFALNRLEFMAVLLTEPKYSESFLLFDRSPFSNALTISYGLTSLDSCNENDLMKYINMSLDLDSLMISKLGLGRCIVQLQSKRKSWENVRMEQGDQYEREEVQEKCDMVYDMYKGVVGPGWHQVVTKNEFGWREKGEIYEDILEIIRATYGEMDNIKNGINQPLGFSEITETLYPEANFDNAKLEVYQTALKDNNKNEMYESAVILGKQVATSCAKVEINDKEVRSEFRRILINVPETVNILRYFLGDIFVEKLLKGLEI